MKRALAVGLAVVALVAGSLAAGGHAYGWPGQTENGGIVLWTHGPGLEVWGTPGLFMEEG